MVAEYSRLPAGKVFIDGLDGLGFNNSDVTVFCDTGESNSSFCGVTDGIDDGISVSLHSRSLVLYGWIRYPFSYKAKDPNILCHARTPGELINAL